MTADKALKPCPRCYSVNSPVLECDNLSAENIEQYTIICSLASQGCGIQTAWHLQPGDAIEDWNSRPTPQTPGDVVEAMCDAYEATTPKAWPQSHERMQAALNAAAAMGYTLAPDERTLADNMTAVPLAIQGEDDVFDPQLVGLQYKDENTGWTDTIGINDALSRAAISKIDGGKG